MKKIVLFSIFLLILFSCFENRQKKGHLIFNDVNAQEITGKSTTAENTSGLNINIDFKNVNEMQGIYFSSVFDSITYIKLEDSPESLIVRPDSVSF